MPRDNGHRVAVEGGVGAGRRLRSLLLVLGPLVVVAAGGYLYLTGGRYVSTDDAYVRYDKVLISSDVAGRVTQQQVDENQPVRQGDLLFALDDEPYRIALARAEGVLAAARDEVRAMRAAYRQKEAMLRAGIVSADYLQREYERQKRLAAQNVSSASKVDEARRSADVAHEQMAAMQHDLAQVLANLGGDPDIPVDSHPRVLQATAARDQAALDLRHTRILAAADGIVANLDPRPGQYVTIGQAMGSLMESGSLYIEANLKETELTYVKPGEAAIVTADSISRPRLARPRHQHRCRHRLGILGPAAAERHRQLGQGRAACAGAPPRRAGRGHRRAARRHERRCRDRYPAPDLADGAAGRQMSAAGPPALNLKVTRRGGDDRLWRRSS